MTHAQAAQSLLMVRPTTFGFDEQTARSNVFQNKPALPLHEIRKQANDEFEAAVRALRQYGVTIAVFEDSHVLDKPDAVFPNNWLSTWPDGTVYLYPMATKSRRIERSQAALDLLRNKWLVNEIIDFSPWEEDGIYLESTGVMIFDHLNKTVYGCLSERCHEDLFRQHASKDLGYTPVVFRAFDETGIPIYHTNVLMGIQTDSAVVCLEAITNETERALVAQCLARTGRKVVTITQRQMRAFCGNVLEIQNAVNERFIVMSQTAYDAFTPAQRQLLAEKAQLLPLTIPTIETVGGGSARCMLAEIFLPNY